MSNYGRGQSLYYGNQVLKAMLRPLSFCLLAMTLFRFMLFLISRKDFQLVPIGDLLMAFFTGLRFDLLILGFVMIPPVLLALVFSLLKLWNWKTVRVLTFYMGLAWGVLMAYSALAGLYFLVHLRHGNRRDVLGDFGALWSQAQQSIDSTTFWMYLIIMFCAIQLASRGFFHCEEKLDEKELLSSKEGSWSAWAFRILAPLFLVALAARGTVTAHHLEKEHSLISSFEVVNQLTLNPAWVFDKETEDR